MVSEAVILTCLPNGVAADGRMKVTAFVTPRLSTGDTHERHLADFPAFVDWPASMATLLGAGKLAIEIENVGVQPADLDPASPALDSATWSLLFDAGDVGVFASQPSGSKPVAGFEDLSDRKVRSFPAGNVADQILGLYGDIALNAPSQFPPVTSGRLSTLRALGNASRNPAERYAEIEKLFGKDVEAGNEGGGYVRMQDVPYAERDLIAFVLARRYYDRPGKPDPKATDPVPPPKKPPLDFHRYVAALGDYPRLLRPLGLAVDLLIERPNGFPEQGRMRIVVDPPGASGLGFAAKAGARPWTNYELQGHRFLPRPRNKEGAIKDGSLRLEDNWFRIHQIDLDGSALKTFDFAATVAQIAGLVQGGQPATTRDEASLPALRTGGFVVTQEHRDQQVVAQLGQASKHETDRALNDSPADLYAEDVTRGVRPDVFDRGTVWRSLTARRGTYEVQRDGATTSIKVAPDEGFVKGASTTSVPTEKQADLYLHEAVFGWEGWSLSVKRPGQALQDDVADPVAVPPATPEPDFPLVTEFAVPPGTLPRLRFGGEYRFRARTVDLAGNSVPEADLATQHESRAEVFRRFDPIPSPAVVPRRRFTEGESLLRLVIRSTLGVPPAAYVALPRIQALAKHTDPDTAYRETNERWLAAPKAAVQLVEWHGELDPGFGKSAPQADVDGSYNVASLESGTFLDPGPGASVVNPNEGATPTDLSTHPKGAALQPGEYVVRDTNDLTLPYLADPASAGVAFTVLPGDASTRQIAWPGDRWPDPKPILLRIEDGGLTTDPAKQPVAGVRELAVPLRQAELVVVRMSSFPTPDGVAFSGILDLLPSPTASQSAATARAEAKAGRHWMLTPFQEVALVHAVEKPLAPPVVAVSDQGMHRNEGETFAVLDGRIDNHAKSTGRLDIEATWTEPIDDVAREAPQDAENLGEVDGQSHVGDFLLEAGENACAVGRDDVASGAGTSAVHRLRHEFRDTKHRMVAYQATATTRFREYFPPEITNKPELITHTGPKRTLNVPSSRRPDPPDVEYVIPTFRWVDDVFRGLPAGLSPADVDANLVRALGGGRRVARVLERGAREHALAAEARVLLPLVRRRVRRAGLRVYLDRPWYSSGADELLAVVLPDQPYIMWPIDADRGLVVEASAKALAEQAAGHLLEAGAVRAGAGAASTERLVRAVQRLRPPARELADASMADATATDPGSLLTAYQVSRLGEVMAALPGFFFVGGDPEKFVTRYGMDPIWGSDPPASGPWIHQFPLRTRVGTGLTLAEAPGRTVAAVGHKPQFDKVRGLWFCDIDIDAGTSYFPFVKLGLARYQPNSISNVHLSRVVAPEWAQLLPDRTATLTRLSAGRARISLRGPGAYSDVAKLVLGQAASGPEGLAMSRFAVAQVERRAETANTDLAWRPASDEVRLELSVATAFSDIRYTGSVEIPAVPEGEQLRVTIREYEILRTDASQADDVVKHDTLNVDTTGSMGSGSLFDIDLGTSLDISLKPDDQPVRFRLVYAGQMTL